MDARVASAFYSKNSNTCVGGKWQGGQVDKKVRRRTILIKIPHGDQQATKRGGHKPGNTPLFLDFACAVQHAPSWFMMGRDRPEASEVGTIAASKTSPSRTDRLHSMFLEVVVAAVAAAAEEEEEEEVVVVGMVRYDGIEKAHGAKCAMRAKSYDAKGSEGSTRRRSA